MNRQMKVKKPTTKQRVEELESKLELIKSTMNLHLEAHRAMIMIDRNFRDEVRSDITKLRDAGLHMKTFIANTWAHTSAISRYLSVRVFPLRYGMPTFWEADDYDSVSLRRRFWNWLRGA